MSVSLFWNGEWGEGRRGGEELTIMGQTALDLALDQGHNKIIQLLVQEGGKCRHVCEGKE